MSTLERKPLPPGTIISFADMEAEVLEDHGGTTLTVRAEDGCTTTWRWVFEGEECQVVRLPA